MAVVNLETAWVNLASDLSQNLALWSADWSDERAVVGEVRTYAGGRRRVVSRVGTRRDLTVTFPAITSAQLETLVGWAGQVILLLGCAQQLGVGGVEVVGVGELQVLG